jgi:hypothetical protein
VKQRSLERVPVDLSAALELADGRSVAAQVSDLSPAGCNLVCRDMLAIGSNVRITIAGADPIDARVMWQLGAASGLNFMTDLPRSTFIRLFDPGKKPKRKS